MLEKKAFAMSMFCSQKDLFEAKADHYENQAEKLEMERVLLVERVAHLELELLMLSMENDKLKANRG